MVRFSLAVAVLGALTLSACGGGGGSSGGGGNPPPVNTNPAPVIAAQTFNGTEDTVLNAQVVGTDTGDTITFAAVTNPMAGTLSSFTTAGAFTYTPNTNFNGNDTFQVRVTDSASQTATATITLALAPAHDPPVANNDIFTVASADALAVLANDTDPDGDIQSVTITGAPFVGTATVAANTVNIQLTTGFKGFTRFNYRITDATGSTSDATALVFVGIEPFKAVMLSPPPPGSTSGGVFVHDLFTSQLVNEAGVNDQDVVRSPFAIALDGRAVAYQYVGANGLEMRYIDLAHPGQSRLVHPALTGNQEFGWMVLSLDSRFVVYEYKPGVNGNETQLMVFDRDAAGPAVRLSGPPSEQAITALGAFSRDGAYLYYPAKTPATQPWTSALYRVNLATRVIERISNESTTQTHAFIWTTPDESKFVDLRFNNGGGMGVYLTTRGTPSSERLLHEPLNSPNVYFPAGMSPDGSWFQFTETDAAFVPVRLGISQLATPGSSRTIGGPSFGYGDLSGYYGTRRDGSAALVGKTTAIGSTYTLYEFQVATPETLVPLFTQSLTIGQPFQAFYSLDGERVTYINSTGTASRVLNVLKRGAFGTPIQVSPAGAYVGFHALDASGRVALIALDGTPKKIVLVNVDAPQQVLELGVASDTTRATIQLTPR